MIKKFNTTVAPSAPAGGAPAGGAPAGGAPAGGAPAGGAPAGGKGINKILVAVLVLGALYAGYQFVYKPMMERRKAQSNTDEQ